MRISHFNDEVVSGGYFKGHFYRRIRKKELCLTNKEAMLKLSNEAFFDKWYWLTHEYGKGFTDTRTAVIEWLGQEAKQDIVQCKECKFWAGNGIRVEDIPYYAPCKTIPRNAEYFCADGARTE